MTTYVLVPGAWHAHQAWERVTPLLPEGGACVVTPDLAAAPSAGLAAHAAQLVAVLDRLPADTGPVILVGHSYAWLVVRQAADRRPATVSHLVLVDGWAARDGLSLLDLAPAWFGDAVRSAAGPDGLVPAPPPAAFGIDDPDDAAWLAPLLRPHPLRSFQEPARLTGAVDAITATGISCRPESFPFAAMATGLGDRDVRLDGPHDVMVSAPAAPAAELLPSHIDFGELRQPRRHRATTDSADPGKLAPPPVRASRLRELLRRRSGSSWRRLASHPLNRGMEQRAAIPIVTIRSLSSKTRRAAERMPTAPAHGRSRVLTARRSSMAR